MVDKGNGCQEETNDNGHEAINDRENVVEGVIRLRKNDGRAANLGSSKDIIRAKATSDAELGAVSVTAALERVLESLSSNRTCGLPFLQEILRGCECIHPNHGSDDQYSNCVHNKGPVGKDQAHGNMILLEDASDGDQPCDEEHDSQNETGGEVKVGDEEVADDIGCAPDDAEGNEDGTGSEKCDVEERPDRLE